MKKDKITLKFTLLVILIILLNFQSKATSTLDSLKAEINKDLKWFNNTRDHELVDSIIMDDLEERLKKNLLKLLTFKEMANLNLKEFPNLKLDASTNDSLKIRFYSFGYLSGATGYEYKTTIIQWQNKNGKLFSYAISSKIGGTIGQISKLKPNLYLLRAQDSSTTNLYVIQFKGDFLILNYPAFIRSPNIKLDHMDITFNPKTQTLLIASYPEVGLNTYDLLQSMRYHSETNPSYKKIITMFENFFNNCKDEYNCSLRLKFTGLKFIE
ncbi:hypothetical protein MYP_4511 [Sporocytophaga myxococcoides]|uniref:Uncharacterized protein n=1 Tax=Sporocytophaga myxococcoides TaxID=153721 RepID=A0A098LJY6_9BACT|nr:hypothetical protein [Sporocytophaga myxococcoides]GAL87281.1 hypothetical protein MYP_4511 [Sporocytophaga myxococcoides]